MANEQDGRRRAQGLLDSARVSQKGSEARAAERALEESRLREQSLRVIEQNLDYQKVIEVMRDPTLDQLLPLFWGVWKPIEMVPEKRIEERQIKIGGRVLRTIKIGYFEDVARPVPFPGLRKIQPLDPVEFINQFPAGGARFGREWMAPVTAYLQSIGLTTIEAEIAQSFSRVGSHSMDQEYYRKRVSEIRATCSSYGMGSCGVIELTSPPPPGWMGNQGKLQIVAGYDLQREGFRIKLDLYSPYTSVAETFSDLTGLQFRLAEILVEKGVTSVD
ncbi:hypothetical protein HYU90_00055 [Candidatus Collierbacteria bacterium]|nr:hypothetical protein [Candidatus Collierbacteria bacterium]